MNGLRLKLFFCKSRIRQLATALAGYCMLCSAFSVMAGVNVESELTHTFGLQPGEMREGVIVLTNNDDESAEVKLEQTDYQFFADGRNVFATAGELPRSNASWISFNRNRVNLLPRESATIRYTIQVPLESELQGTYWSMLMVEPTIIPPSTADLSEENTNVALGQVIRYGIQFVTNVGEDGSYRLRFVDKRLESSGEGELLFLLDMENVGEQWLTPDVWLDIFDNEGNFIGHFTSRRKRIYPGTSVRHQFNLSQLPPGKYKALVVADNGDEHVFGAQYTLEL